MNETASTVTFSEAARLMGWRSRSQLYRLRDAGALRDYLMEGEKGAMVLALEPPGLPSLQEHLVQLVRTQINSPGRPPKHPPPDPVTVAEREVCRLQRELAKVKGRERNWIRDYTDFRKWASEKSWLELHKELGEAPTIGDVMV